MCTPEPQYIHIKDPPGETTIEPPSKDTQKTFKAVQARTVVNNMVLDLILIITKVPTYVNSTAISSR